MDKPRVIFVGAGPGDPELITVKGQKALERADVVIYAGSLVSNEVLGWCKAGAELIDSSGLTFEGIISVYAASLGRGLNVVRLHSGDPGLYGAIQEQIDWLAEKGHDFEVIPGVTAAFAAAAALGRELTLPEVSQTVILTRATGRTMVPDSQNLDNLARAKATLCLYLSVDKLSEIVPALLQHYKPTTPAAIVYRASQPDQLIWRSPLKDLAETARRAGVKKSAVVLIGPALAGRAVRSKLYDKEFYHGCRSGD